MVKPGILTTEFWITLISQIIGLLVITGKLKPDEGQAVVDGLNMIVKGVVDLIAALYMIYTAVTYIRGRIHLKEKAKNGTTEANKV